MSIGLVIFIALIGVPLLEIAVFIEVGGRVGLWSTLGLIFATAAIGATLIRLQGLSVLADARRSVEQGELPVRALLDGVCLLIAGALLLTPGFVTDAAGAILLITPFRRIIQAVALRWIAAHGSFTIHRSRGPGGTVIDGEFVAEDDDFDDDLGDGGPPTRSLPPR